MTSKSVTAKSGTFKSVRSQQSPVLGRFPVPLRILGYTAVAAIGLLYLMPFVIQLVTGFKTDPDAAAHPLFRERRRVGGGSMSRFCLEEA